MCGGSSCDNMVAGGICIMTYLRILWNYQRR